MTETILANIVQLKETLLTAELENLLTNAQQPSYLAATENPEELIIQLYRDLSEAVLLKSDPALENLDLHQLCADIADRARLDITKIRESVFQVCRMKGW